MRRRAEAVECRACRAVPGHRVGAVADQPGAQQRRRVHVVVRVGQREDVARVGDRVFRVAAVALIAGEARVGAEVLAARSAVVASAAGAAEPRHADARADAGPVDARSARGRRCRRSRGRGRAGSFGIRQLAVDECRSVRQTPQARTAICTSPGPGSGRGSVRSASGRPAPSHTIARIVALIGSFVLRLIRPWAARPLMHPMPRRIIVAAPWCNVDGGQRGGGRRARRRGVDAAPSTVYNSSITVYPYG